MEEYVVKILELEWVTHDVRKIIVEKPQGYTFIPGQATEVAINKQGLEEEKRPFTFTSLNDDPNLEFTIKVYEPDGITKEIGNLKVGDELLLHDVWGSINYKGPGYFIAGGAGATPFFAIFRQLHKDGKINGNKFLYANKTAADIIYEEEIKKIFGDHLILTLTREEKKDYYYGHIDKKFLQKHVKNFDSYFYVCSTPEMIDKTVDYLKELGVSDDKIVLEQ